MRGGAVLRAGHGDPGEGDLARAERGRRERAGHGGEQGGVHQVEEGNAGTWGGGGLRTLTPAASPSLLTNWRFTRGVKEQTRAFLDGFNEVVPLEWLRYFDEKELEVRKVEPPSSFRKTRRPYHVESAECICVARNRCLGV